MAKESTIAPRERINITYKPATGGAQEEIELPLKLLMMGDYTLRPDERVLEDRAPINIDKDNFNEVMKKQELALNLTVPNRLTAEEGEEMPVKLQFDTLRDFEPESLANQIPELNKLLDLRSALTALKGPLGNVPAFRKKIQELLGDDKARTRLLDELGVEEPKEDGK